MTPPNAAIPTGACELLVIIVTTGALAAGCAISDVKVPPFEACPSGYHRLHCPAGGFRVAPRRTSRRETGP
jgi:hypothetical protein